MANDEKKVNRWVEERMARLEPAREWQPDAERALARVHVRDRKAMAQRRRWGLTVAGAAVLAVVLLVIPGCQAASCEVPSRNLAERLWKSVFPATAESAPKSAPAQAFVGPVARPAEPPAAVPVAQAVTPPLTTAANTTPRPASALPKKNYKLSGSPAAKVTVEVYTDYECPACARFYAEVMPRLVAEYVATGKVRLLHRDYPLTQHMYSKLAARYANAAGALGHYDEVVQQLFRTQAAWGITGEVDSQVAQVLSPSVMEQVRKLVQSDARLDDTVDADLAQGRADKLTQTPTITFVWDGRRRTTNYIDYGLLKSLLDDLLTK